MSPPLRKFLIALALAALVITVPVAAATVMNKSSKPTVRRTAAATSKTIRLARTAPVRRLSASAQPTNLKVTSTTQTSIVVSWQISKSTSRLRQAYSVYLNGVQRSVTTSTSYTFSGLTCASAYRLGVSLQSATSPKVSVVATTVACVASSAPQPIAAPGTPTVTAATTSTVSVSWAASPDPSVVSYGVYLDGSSVGHTSSASYTVSGLACGTSHQFAVDAADAAGDRSGKSTATVATAACPDTLAPQAPANLDVANTSATAVEITWTPSLDNVGVAGYTVYVNGNRVGTVATTAYTFTGLTCGISYAFGVEAYDAAGNVSPRSTVTTSTSACSDTTSPTAPSNVQWISATATSVSISWTASSDNVGVTGYTVYQNGSPIRTATTNAAIVISGLNCSTAYGYAVDAYDGAGNHSSRTSITAKTSACASGDTTPPSAPTNLAAAASVQSITLTWTAASDNVGVTGYTVYVNGSQAGQAGTTTGYAVANLTCNTGYTLAVEAKDAAGNVSSRPSISASTAPCSAPSPPPPPPPSAVQLFVTPTGNDSTCARGDATKPCATFERAYQLAQLGDSVQVNAGTYPNQLLTDSSGKTGVGAAIAFQANGVVNLAGLSLGDQFTNPNAADNLKFVGFHGTTAWNVLPGANNITFDHVQTANIYANGTNGYTVTNSDFGNCTVTDLNGPCDNFKIEGNATNVLIDHDTFHDFRVAAGSTAHFECFFLADSHYVTISNSTFTNCEYYDIFTQTQTAGIAHITISGNRFDLAWAGGQHNRQTALNISDRSIAFDNWTINDNIFSTGSGFTWDPTGSYTNFHIAGDTFGLPAVCIPGASYSNNSWSSGTC